MSQPFASTRRSFLIASGITALASTRALGANDTLRIGVIGAGQRMGTLLNCAEQSGPHQIVAIADPYRPHREAVLKRDSAAGATLHVDYREVLDNHSIDTVLIATPDHWHVRIATAALAAGKDVYLEKPVTHTLEESDTLLKAVRSSRQILQCGMQQRSWTHFRDAARMIREGELGRVHQVRTYWYQNYQRSSAPGSARTATGVNLADLDWKQWLGSAPDQPFNEDRFYRWRWYWNFGGGAMTDLFAHWIDVVHMALGSDAPSNVFMLGDKYHFDQWECPDTVQAALRYPAPVAPTSAVSEITGGNLNKEPRGLAANGPFDVVYEGMMASSIDDGGLEFRGTEATLKINRSGLTVFREGVRGDQNPVITEHSTGDGTVTHMQNFFSCVRDRREPNAPVEAGISCARAGHLCNQAYHGNGQTTWPQKS